MTETIQHPISSAASLRRKELAAGCRRVFENESQVVLADGALPGTTKQPIAVAVAHVIQCPSCIKAHIRLACRNGASGAEIMEAIRAAAEMRADDANAHSTLAMQATNVASSDETP